jgi:ribosomal protein S11
MSDKNYNSNFNLNKFLKKLVLKKKYIKTLTDKICLLENIKEQNFKILNNNLFSNNFIKHDTLIVYIIDISFSRSNTLLHVMDSSGILKFFCSAGDLSYSGKSKKSRISVLTSMIRVLMQKLKFLQGKPIALHLKNVGFKKFWIVKKLKKKFFIKIVRSFNLYPHNGCRKKKVRRKKFKKRITRRNG